MMIWKETYRHVVNKAVPVTLLILKHSCVDVCGHCHKKCSPLSKVLQCDLCSAWVHATCEGLTKMQYGSINQLTKSIVQILNDFLTVPSSNLPTRSSVLRTRFTHNFKLTPYQPNIDLYKYSFLPRTVPEWNRLDEDVIQFNCIELCKQN